MGYIVKAALVGVNGVDGKLKYLYAGTAVPADVAKEDLDRLEEGGLIVKDDTTPVVRAKAPAKKPSEDSGDSAS